MTDFVQAEFLMPRNFFDGSDCLSKRADPVDVINAINKACSTNNMQAMLALVAQDAVYTLYIDENILAFAGESRGKEAIQVALDMMRTEFEYILYRPFPAKADGNRVRQQVEFIYKHRASGEELSGRFRLVWVVENGLVTSCEEYHDRARIEAFARMVGQNHSGAQRRLE